MFDLRFLNIPRKEITLDKINEFLSDDRTKRIHFETTHANALRRSEKKERAGELFLPFQDTINPISKSYLGSDFTLFKSNKYSNYYRIVKTKDEIEKIENFLEDYKSIVFLRDLLDLSLTLSMNFDNDKYSNIGELEYLAKFKDDKDAELKLVEICKYWLEKLPYYKSVDCICAMPCSNRSEKSLPRRIVDALGGFENISDSVCWESKTKSLKDSDSVEEKLAILEESKLVINRNLEGKAIFLFDDLYMSGLSMQYVAMKLKEVGAKWVFGLCLVKSRNNTIR